MHGGHTNHLTDFSWNPNDPWLVCSAAEDNILQVWKDDDGDDNDDSDSEDDGTGLGDLEQ
jgi:histone-binding protein RBBP4